MRRATAAAVLLLAAGMRPAAAEEPGDLPPGSGRDEAFFVCSACHSFALVRAQAMSRERWAETMAMMTSRHGMAPLDPELREAVLGYLAATFAEPAAPRGFVNPFLTR